MSEEYNFEDQEEQKFEEPKNGNINYYFTIGSHGLRSRLASFPNLSKREIDILVLIRCNLSIKDKAKYLSLSERTIETHRSNIREKIGLEQGKSLYKFVSRLDGEE